MDILVPIVFQTKALLTITTVHSGHDGPRTQIPGPYLTTSTAQTQHKGMALWPRHSFGSVNTPCRFDSKSLVLIRHLDTL